MRGAHRFMDEMKFIVGGDNTEHTWTTAILGQNDICLSRLTVGPRPLKHRHVEEYRDLDET